MVSRPASLDRARGSNFDDPAVASAYALRPPYADDFYQWLREIAGPRRAMLDLGCGNGKIAGPLTRDFDRVDAIDPSGPMLAQAELEWGSVANWHVGRAEDWRPKCQYDLITCGAAIHWMDEQVLMPQVLQWLTPGASLVIADGDGAVDPPWQDVWVDFLKDWLQRIGDRWDPVRMRQQAHRWEPLVDIIEVRTFGGSTQQPLADFVALQHSRATWTEATMGADMARQFDAELHAALSPWADEAGNLKYRTAVQAYRCRPSVSM